MLIEIYHEKTKNVKIIRLNAKKTKKEDKKRRGKALEQINKMVYLGSMLSTDGKTMDVKRRIAIGKRVKGACLSCIDETRKCKHSCTFSRMTMYIMLYDSERWVLQKKN